MERGRIQMNPNKALWEKGDFTRIAASMRESGEALVAQILKIGAACSPPPPEGFVSPVTWGVEASVVERFTGAGVPKDKISCAKDTYVFNFVGTPAEFVDAFRKFYGPTMNAFDAA